MYKKEIEALKGIAILFILIPNGIDFWYVANGSWNIIIAVLVLILELFGATFYIFLNSFNISFLIEKKMGCVASKKNKNKLLKQAIFLFILGIPFNMINNINLGLPFNIWGWNIITFLGFSQIICYIAYKMVRWTRIVIALIIIFQTPFLREVLFYFKDTHIIPQIIYYILVSPYPNYSPLPYTAFCLFSTVFGELIYEAKLLDSQVAELNAIKSILKYGILLLTIGLVLPIAEFRLILTETSYNPNDYPFIDMPSILKANYLIFISNLPSFLLKGTQSNVIISLGISLLLIGSIFHLYFYKKKKGIISRIVMFYGKTSLTMLFLQFIFLFSFYQLFYGWFILVGLIIFIASMGLIVYLWNRLIKWIPNVDQLLEHIIEDIPIHKIE